MFLPTGQSGTWAALIPELPSQSCGCCPSSDPHPCVSEQVQEIIGSSQSHFPGPLPLPGTFWVFFPLWSLSCPVCCMLPLTACIRGQAPGAGKGGIAEAEMRRSWREDGAAF
jgi:hypothetical protein